MQLKSAITEKEAEDGIEYVPDFRGNREEPVEKQGYVVIQPMTARELQKVERGVKIKMTAKDDVLGIVDRKAWISKERAIKDRVLEAHNIWADAKTEIKTGAELWDFCMDAKDASLIDLIDDIWQAIRDLSKLEEGARKNSSLRPATLSAVTAG